MAFQSYLLKCTLNPIFGSIPLENHHKVFTSLLSVLPLPLAMQKERMITFRKFIKPYAVALICAISNPFVVRLISEKSREIGIEKGPILVWSLLQAPCWVFGITNLYEHLLKLCPESLQYGLPLLGSFTIPSIEATLKRLLTTSFLKTYMPTQPFNYLKLLSIPLTIIAVVIALGLGKRENEYLLSNSKSRNLLIIPILLLAFTFSNLQPKPFNEHYPILASAQSTTGQIIVGEDLNQGFRYMRADHSLLGGLWVGPAKESLKQQLKISEIDDDLVINNSESIYTTFLLQEATRLVKRPDVNQSLKPKAMIIGLGIGVTADGFNKHGVDLSISEIDPVVFKYATQYFGSPLPTSLKLKDARRAVKEWNLEIGNEEDKYDYIIHDVFTGGGVPSRLFTSEAWEDIKYSLKSNGVLAVNFAGIASSKASNMVIGTLLNSFPQCRAFSDRTIPETSDEFINMVVFCTKFTENEKPLEFRSMNENDHLNSILRNKILNTFKSNEINLNSYKSDNVDDLLYDYNHKNLDNVQVGSAKHHWEVMRQVLPDQAWLSNI